MAERAPDYAVHRFKQEDGRSVWLVRLPGGEMRIIKRWRVNFGVFVRIALGISQAQRQLRGAKRLRAAGVPTPASIGSWELRRAGDVKVLEIALAFWPGDTAIEILERGDLDRVRLRRTADRIGMITAQIAKAGLVHRDLKLANIIVNFSSPDDPTPEVVVLDPVGVRIMRDPVTATERMLERLAVQPAARNLPIPFFLMLQVMRAALKPLGRDDRRAVIARLKRRRGNTAETRRRGERDRRQVNKSTGQHINRCGTGGDR